MLSPVSLCEVGVKGYNYFTDSESPSVPQACVVSSVALEARYSLRVCLFDHNKNTVRNVDRHLALKSQTRERGRHSEGLEHRSLEQGEHLLLSSGLLLLPRSESPVWARLLIFKAG